MRIYRHLLFLGLLVTAIGCAPKVPPNVSPIGQTAVLGRQFVVAGTGAVRGLDAVMESGMLPVEYGVPVLSVMKRVGDEAVRLADILRAIDEAKTAAQRTDAIGRARAVIVGMRSLLDGAALPIADSKAKSVVVSALSTLSAILLDFGDALMLLADGGHPPGLQLNASAEALEEIPYTWATSPLLLTRR